MEHTLSQHELSGGAKLAVINVPGAVSSYLGSYVRSGKAFAPADLHELSHLLEHLAFEGTSAYPDPLEFKALVEQHGAYFNAFTGEYLNWYEMVGENSEVERLVPLAISQLYEADYAPERIKQQQETVVNELKRYQENDGRRLRHYSNKRIVPTWCPEIDDRMAMTKAITRNDLVAFRKAYYGTANTYFVVAGDFDERRIAALIKQLNGELKGKARGVLKDLPRPPYVDDFGGAVEVYKPYRQNQSSFLLRAKVLKHDVIAAAGLKLFATMYTSGLSSRMNMKAREAGLTYSIGSSGMLNLYDTEFAVSSETDIEKLRPLVELSMHELAALAAGKYSDAELDRAKSYATGQMRRAFETPMSLARWYGDDLALGLALVSPDEWIEQLQALGRSQLDQIAQEYFRCKTMTLTLIGADLADQKADYNLLLKDHFGKMHQEA